MISFSGPSDSWMRSAGDAFDFDLTSDGGIEFLPTVTVPATCPAETAGNPGW